MNKHIRYIPVLILSMTLLSIPTLATAVTTINVVDQATLVAKGAGALVTVEVTCPSSFGDGSSIQGSLSLTQRVGNLLAQGNSFFNVTITCNGRPQSFPILVTAEFTRPFHKGGPVIARASGSVCDSLFEFCESAQEVTEVIRIVR